MKSWLCSEPRKLPSLEHGGTSRGHDEYPSTLQGQGPSGQKSIYVSIMQVRVIINDHPHYAK